MNRMRLCFFFLISALGCFAQYPLTITPYQIIDGRNGAAKSCNNCSIYTYAAGTTTPLATYTDSMLGTTLPNPVKTNAAGYAVSNSGAITGIWTSGSVCYKIILKDAGAVTVWSQDNVCNPAIAASNLQTLLASSAGSSYIGFIQSGTGAVAETVQAKLRQKYNVLDFGAVCDGSTDDRAKIQAAIDAVISGTLNFPNNQKCAVSAPGLFLYPANAGITLNGLGATPSVPGSTPQGGLIATASSSPTALLTVYAYNTILNNLYLDGNAKAATNCLVAAGGGGSSTVWTSVTVHNCAGDGVLVIPASGNTTAVATGGAMGTNTFTVSSPTTNRNTFNAFYCGSLVFAPGTANAEFHTVTGSGTSWTLGDGNFAHNQNGQQVGCNGNNNELQISFLNTNNNGGYGFHETAATDSNGIWMVNPHSSNNVSGGELWEGGAVDQHYGGEYQGDTGPMITLGLAANTSGTSFMTVTPLADQEEGGSGNNIILIHCDNSSTIWQDSDALISFPSESRTCSAPSTSAFGTFIDGVGNGWWNKTFAAETYFFGSSIFYKPTGGSAGQNSLFSPCVVTAETGMNNAIVASCDAGGYQGTTFTAGFTVRFLATTYSLRSGGANTLNLNGSGVKTIGACLTPSGFQSTAILAGASFDVVWRGDGDWCILGAN
jgi:hypothetical protein